MADISQLRRPSRDAALLHRCQLSSEGRVTSKVWSDYLRAVKSRINIVEKAHQPKSPDPLYGSGSLRVLRL